MGIHPTDNYRVGACQVTPYTKHLNNECLEDQQLGTASKDSYRLYCLNSFRATNYLDFALSGPLNLHWLYPEQDDRHELRPEQTKPEWITDLGIGRCVTPNRPLVI